MLDTESDYGRISRINHWLAAALVVVLLAIGLYFHEMPRGDEKLFWLRLHIALGVIALPILFWRIGWRLLFRAPRPLPQHPALQAVANAVPPLMLTAVAVLLITGPLAVWSGGHDIQVFGWFVLPTPLFESTDLHEALEAAHAIAADTLLVLLALHILGALKHTLIDRDGTLRRITTGE